MKKLIPLFLLLTLMLLQCKSAEEKQEDQQVDDLIEQDQERYDSLKKELEK